MIHCRTAEAHISKKWYNLFVSVGPETAESSPAEENSQPPRNPAQTVAEIASSIAAEPKFTTPISAAGGFDEIYHAAEIPEPPHGYSIMKIAEMLQSERIRALPAEVKKNSILLALDASGVKIEQVIEDAVKRDRALDGFERVQQKALDDLEARKEGENQQIQAEVDKLVQEHNARIQANKDEVANTPSRRSPRCCKASASARFRPRSRKTRFCWPWTPPASRSKKSSKTP